MKKALSLILALIMVSVLFVSCSNNTPDVEGTSAPAPSTNADPGTTTKAPEASKKPETTKKPETSKAPETTAVPEIPVPAVADGIMVYYEDFELYPNTADSDAVAKLLGWQIRNKTMEGEELGALTDNTTQYSIENGALKLVNHDGGNITGKDSYMLMVGSDYMKPAAVGNYTFQYDVKYLAAANEKRYIAIVCNYDGYDTYNSFHLRANGSANNQVRFLSSWYTYDVPGEFYAAGNDSADKGSSIANKLYGLTYDGSALLYEKSITIRYQVDKDNGPTIWLRANDAANPEFVCVSKPDAGANGTLYWNSINHYALCLKTGAAIDGYVDNIAVWTGLGDMPLDVNTVIYENTIASYLDEVKKAG